MRSPFLYYNIQVLDGLNLLLSPPNGLFLSGPHHIYAKSDGGCCCRDPPMIIFFLFILGSFCYSRVICFLREGFFFFLDFGFHIVVCGCPPLFCSASFYLSVAGQLSERLSIHVHIYRSSVFSLFLSFLSPLFHHSSSFFFSSVFC